MDYFELQQLRKLPRIDLNLGFPYIRTRYKKNFRFDEFNPENILIEDIAHALSHLCRYGGHSEPFYSVAQHSIAASYLVKPENALCALLHDATEAYMVDLPRPVKMKYPQYSIDENILYKVIAKKFNLPLEIPKEVKAADDDMIYIFEWNYFMENEPIPELEKFYKTFFLPKTYAEIKCEFLQRYENLIKNHKLETSINEQVTVK